MFRRLNSTADQNVNLLLPRCLLGWALTLSAFASALSLPGAYAFNMDAPEAQAAWQDKPAVSAKRHMVVAANPLAAEAGRKILRAGGSAIDAAIATQFVLALVEPQSSGLGGGAVMLVYDENSAQVRAYDGRETAPRAVDETLFLQNRQPMSFDAAVVGGRSVGVPGLLRMLALAHQRHGRLPWAALFQPAMDLAESGFVISPRLAYLLTQAPRLKEDPQARAYFYDEQGLPKKAGTLLRNPLLADVFRTLARDGVDAFYQGKIADDIVAAVKSHPSNPGLLDQEDLRHYQAKERVAVCGPFRRWRVCGMSPPSSGGIAVAQILGILATLPPLSSSAPSPRHFYLNEVPGAPKNKPDSEIKAPIESQSKDIDAPPATASLTAEQAHYFSEAGRLAFADRDRYVADDDFVPLPGGSWHSLLDPSYLAERAALIGPRSLNEAAPGNPLGASLGLVSQVPDEAASTSHISIVDDRGQAVSLTASIETGFGAHIMVHGFLLNNQLTDFSFIPQQKGQAVANRVQPGKRPRSSMAPTLVLEGNEIKMIVGSPGGPNIINYVAKTIVAALDWEFSLHNAVNSPNFGSRNGPTEVERGLMPLILVVGLQGLGHTVKAREMNSGVHAIMRVGASSSKQSPSPSLDMMEVKQSDAAMWIGVADARREGVALAD